MKPFNTFHYITDCLGGPPSPSPRSFKNVKSFHLLMNWLWKTFWYFLPQSLFVLHFPPRILFRHSTEHSKHQKLEFKIFHMIMLGTPSGHELCKLFVIYSEKTFCLDSFPSINNITANSCWILKPKLMIYGIFRQRYKVDFSNKFSHWIWNNAGNFLFFSFSIQLERDSISCMNKGNVIENIMKNGKKYIYSHKFKWQSIWLIMIFSCYTFHFWH